MDTISQLKSMPTMFEAFSSNNLSLGYSERDHSMSPIANDQLSEDVISEPPTVTMEEAESPSPVTSSSIMAVNSEDSVEMNRDCTQNEDPPDTPDCSENKENITSAAALQRETSSFEQSLDRTKSKLINFRNQCEIENQQQSAEKNSSPAESRSGEHELNKDNVSGHCSHIEFIQQLIIEVNQLRTTYSTEISQLQRSLRSKSQCVDRLARALRDSLSQIGLQSLASNTSTEIESDPPQILPSSPPPSPTEESMVQTEESSKDCTSEPVLDEEMFISTEKVVPLPCINTSVASITSSASSNTVSNTAASLPETSQPVASMITSSQLPDQPAVSLNQSQHLSFLQIFQPNSSDEAEPGDLGSSSSSSESLNGGIGVVGSLVEGLGGVSGGSLAAGPPLDTHYVAQLVREKLSLHSIGQRLFAKRVLGLSQGTVSELLSKPKIWTKLTEKGRESYRRMHQWAVDDENVLALKALTPRKGHVNFSPTISVKEDQATEEKISEILKEAKKAMASEDTPGHTKKIEELNGCLIKQDLTSIDWSSKLSSLKLNSTLSAGLETSNQKLTDLSTGTVEQSQALVRQICYLQLAKLARTAVKPEVIKQYETQLVCLENAYPELKQLKTSLAGDFTGSTESNAGCNTEQVADQNYENSFETNDENNLTPSAFPATDSSFGGVNRLVAPPIAPSVLERCPELNTEQVVRRIKDILAVYSISQRVFGEQVLGELSLSQGSVSDLLARPKSWNVLTHKGREPFVRMQLFLDDPDAINRLLAHQYSPPALPFGDESSETNQSPSNSPPPVLHPALPEVSISSSRDTSAVSFVPKSHGMIFSSSGTSTMTSASTAGSDFSVSGGNTSTGFSMSSPAAASELLLRILSTAALQHQQQQLLQTQHGQFVNQQATNVQTQQIATVNNLLFPMLNPVANFIGGIHLANQNALQQQQQQLDSGSIDLSTNGKGASIMPLFMSSNVNMNASGNSSSLFNFPSTQPQISTAINGFNKTESGASLDTSMVTDLSCSGTDQDVIKDIASDDPLDTIDISNRVKELLLSKNLGQRLFGEAVLGLSQGSVSELLSKPKPWAQLSLKGREPYIRMNLWLQDPEAPAALKRTQLDLRTNRQRHRILAPSPSLSPPLTSPTSTFQTSITTTTTSSIQQSSPTILPLNLSSITTPKIPAPQPRPAATTPIACIEPSAATSVQYATSKSCTTPSRNLAPQKQTSACRSQTTGSTTSNASDSSSTLVVPQKKPRIVFTDHQRQSLLESYAMEPYPRVEHLEELARNLRLPSKTVSNWFHNHRMRSKVPGTSSSKPSTTSEHKPNAGHSSSKLAPLPFLVSKVAPDTPDFKSEALTDETQQLTMPQLDQPNHNGSSCRRKRPNPTRLLQNAVLASPPGQQQTPQGDGMAVGSEPQSIDDGPEEEGPLSIALDATIEEVLAPSGKRHCPDEQMA